MEEILLFKYVRSLVEKIKSSQKGQGMVEYALIIAFVAVIAITVFGDTEDETTIGGAVNAAFDNAANQIVEANNAAGGEQ